VVKVEEIIGMILSDHGFMVEYLGNKALACWVNRLNFGNPGCGAEYYFVWDCGLQLVVIEAAVDNQVILVVNLNEPDSIRVIEEFLCRLVS
jgi:hypothetical protein